MTQIKQVKILDKNLRVY